MSNSSGQEYFQRVLSEIDSPSTPAGVLRLGAILEETGPFTSASPRGEEKSRSSSVALKRLVRALHQHLDLEQYPSSEISLRLVEDPEEIFARYYRHLYWVGNSQSDDEASRHNKALRRLRTQLPLHVTTTLEFCYDLQEGAVDQELGALQASFYSGSKGYAIEFSILPEESTCFGTYLRKQTPTGEVHLVRTDFMTVVLSYLKGKTAV